MYPKIFVRTQARGLRAVAILAAMVGAVLAAPAATAATEPHTLSAECVPAEAKKNIDECPGGPSQFEVKKARGTAFKSAPPPREAKARQDQAKAGAVDASLAQSIRASKLAPRKRALLITEIDGLERLFKSTPKKSPDRPQLIKRLAEGYVELETAALSEKTKAEIEAQDYEKGVGGKKKDAKKAAKAKKEAATAGKFVKAARKKAIAFYTLMKAAYPNYSKIDEILYYLAYEYEQDGNLKKAREVYFELIEKAPKSPFVPNAYLAFGELFYQEALGDPNKWALAEGAYAEVIKYPPPENKVYGYARYKLGYVHWNQGNYKEAMSEFKKVIEYGEQYATLPNAAQLAKSARRDLIPVYAVSGVPEQAFGFFKPLSGDKGGETTKTIEMLNELGLAYLDTGHYKEAITLYRDLMVRDKGKRECFYQAQITGATSAVKASDKEAIRKEMDAQIAMRNQYQKSEHPADAKLECDNKTAELLAETGMSWHLEAVGSGGVRGTGDKKTMDLAAYLYKRISETFTSQDFAKFEFPRIVKEDWPTLYKIKYAMADLLYFQQRWEECGPAFDAVVAENPTGADAAEAAYAAVLCYQKMYDAMYKGEADRKGKGLGPKGADKSDQEAKKGEWERFKPKELTPLQKGMLTAFNRYVCYIKPPKGDTSAEEQYVEVKYARARTYFEAQRWEEAALGFRDVAMNHSDKDAAIYAAQLYLEAINVLGARAEPPRPSCFDDMGKDVPLLLERFCQGKKAEDNKEQCELLNRIQCDIRRMRAQKTVELADSLQDKGQTREALDKYKEGGDAYLELWRVYGEEPLAKGEKSQCGKMDEIVYNMARAYQAARLLAKSIQARLILLNPKYKLEKTDLAMKATYEIGGNYQAIAVYDRAADFYVRYAEATKYKGEFADQALSDTVVLRLGLGQEDEAIKAANDYNRYFGAKKPAQAAQIAFAVAAHYSEKQQWEDVRKRLTGAMGLIDGKATLDVKVQAHALLGRTYVRMNRGQNAGAEYGTVVKLWSDPKKALAEIDALPEDEGAKQRRLGRALEAVGEALFYFAEQKRAKVDAVKFPEYKGPGTKEEVLKHIQTKVADWIKKKKPLIDEATAEYKKIIDLQPVPPPRWVIAAGSRVGQMWATFVKEFRAAPIPESFKRDTELRQAYFAALDESSEPQKQVAKGAYRTCLEYSVKYQYFDEYSRACEAWLAENYKSEYHLVDEFSGSASRVNSTLKERPYPLKIGGEPLITAPPSTEPEKPKPGEGGAAKPAGGGK
ncbi:MAG: tetratricopeptide repeat protein [Polyangiaceae bacterium]|nr:tetratricopeptide repeat protein [Polyangiaceae bacterium]